MSADIQNANTPEEKKTGGRMTREVCNPLDRGTEEWGEPGSTYCGAKHPE